MNDVIEVSARFTGPMRVEATNGRQVTVMDEPEDKGGQDGALTPDETLMAALAGCTAITLRMYSERKGWPLEDVHVRATLERPERGSKDPTQRITQHVELVGPLDDDQRARLLQIAGRCPVHRTLEAPLAFEERLVTSVDA